MRAPFSQSSDARRVLSCNSDSKHPRRACTHAVQSKPNCAYCYFYIAAHPRSTPNCSCVAQVPGSSDSVDAPQTPSRPPQGHTCLALSLALDVSVQVVPIRKGGRAPLAHKSRTHHRLRLVILGHGALRVFFPLLHCLFLRVDSCLRS